MADEETLRKSVIQDSQTYGSRRRFGLFNLPISTAVGDNGQYKKKMHPRDPQNNKPITEPKNFYTSPTKSGQVNSGYFEGIKSLATSMVKDEFLEPGRRLQKQEKQKRDKGKKHEVSFFTGAGNKILNKSSYEYVQQKNPELDPKRNRDQDGRVRSQPRNFYSNQTSTVEKSLFKTPEHLNDPYDRADKLQRQHNKKNREKEGEQKFRPNSFSPKLFNPVKSVYGQDVQLKKKQPKQTKLNIYKHDSAWKSSNPNKKGLYGTFQPYPVYKQNPVQQVKRKSPQQKVRENFKLNSTSSTVPTPSITLNRSNILRSVSKH